MQSIMPAHRASNPVPIVCLCGSTFTGHPQQGIYAKSPGGQHTFGYAENELVSEVFDGADGLTR